MTIHVALNHRTSYTFSRSVLASPHLIRLRPAPHCRTPIRSYSLKVQPENHFIHWQQDPQSNYLARITFEGPIERLSVEVDLVAEMTVINPFDFFLEPHAETFPFGYDPWQMGELKPFLVTPSVGPLLAEYLDGIDRSRRKTVDFLVDLNRQLSDDIEYVIRMEPGVQEPEETLQRRRGSCRDSAWLLISILRHLGLAARFCSGYLIQLTADQKALDGPAGPDADFTDLHAWTEVYLPGAGWVGLDPTSGLMAGEGHIPLACTPNPTSAAPVTGATERCEVEFGFSMNLTRILEDPRVTLPYDDSTWRLIETLGHTIDRELEEHDVRLTMGGEPTFVSIDDQEGAEWNTAATGPTKLRLAHQLLCRLKSEFGPGGLLHFGLGKWYPGEPLPRWALRCFWRRDGEPLWSDRSLLADPDAEGPFDNEDARHFAATLAQRLGVSPGFLRECFEDPLYYIWRERRLPANVDIRNPKLDCQEERERFARIFERGLTKPVGLALPLNHQWWSERPAWVSGDWLVRSDEMFLLPGDSPMGLRLPLQSLARFESPGYPVDRFPHDPMAAVPELRAYADLRAIRQEIEGMTSVQRQTKHLHQHDRSSNSSSLLIDDHGETSPWTSAHHSPGTQKGTPDRSQAQAPLVRTALCIEPRQGRLYVFLPPLDRLESFVELIAAIEATAAELQMPVLIEGYTPPADPRLQHLSVTPDPGVIEVNIQPARNWDELVKITTTVYEEARQCRLGAEKFDTDGTHTGTGGGNHVVLGGPTPADSPFLRRPDLLRSLLGYWINHPSLSYLFCGKFIGPTSQAPRVDEGRAESLDELQIAFEQIPESGSVPPWLVDRIFRHLLVDLTGNTHRSEFCIDKLFNPDSSSGRLGLVEFRAFEMPPHPRMSLTQQLLLRALVARFWNQPYRQKLVHWGTTLHDRWLLPHFVWNDFADVIEEMAALGYPLEARWFAPHFEFRFPVIGRICQRGLEIELRDAIEPWYVLGEEASGGGTSRYVDSSVERMQVLVRGMTDPRHVLTCNGRRLPLHPTGTAGEYVCGVRYRAWQPPSCLHPTIPVDGPLVFDVLDSWTGRSIGGGRYSVGHPGGLNPTTFPVNANEAEARRGARFQTIGHTGGSVEIPSLESNPRFPLTLDLRRGR